MSTVDLQPIASVLKPEYETFARYVAAGLSYRKAARQAGFHEATATDLVKNQDVRARINELIEAGKREDISGIVSRTWLESRFVALADELEEGVNKERRADIIAQASVLMSLGKLKGYVVERSARMNVSTKVERDDMAAMLDALEPGARTKLLALAETIDTDSERASHGRAHTPAPPRTTNSASSSSAPSAPAPRSERS